MNEKLAKNSQRILKKFKCEDCDYECSKNSDYDKHINTYKHKKNTRLNAIEPEKSHTTLFTCARCSKTYKGRNGLWYHEQKCINNTNFNKCEIQPENVKNNFVFRHSYNINGCYTGGKCIVKTDCI